MINVALTRLDMSKTLEREPPSSVSMSFSTASSIPLSASDDNPGTLLWGPMLRFHIFSLAEWAVAEFVVRSRTTNSICFMTTLYKPCKTVREWFPIEYIFKIWAVTPFMCVTPHFHRWLYLTDYTNSITAFCILSHFIHWPCFLPFHTCVQFLFFFFCFLTFDSYQEAAPTWSALDLYKQNRDL